MTSRRIAMAAVQTASHGYIIVITEEGLPGYVPDPREPLFLSWEPANARAKELNAALGLTEIEAWAVVADTIRRSLAEPNGQWKVRAT